MEPNIIYINSYVEGNKIDSLINEIKWVDDQYARRECFMSDTHKHKIPRNDKPCGPRISLTFRCWKRED